MSFTQKLALKEHCRYLILLKGGYLENQTSYRELTCTQNKKSIGQ